MNKRKLLIFQFLLVSMLLAGCSSAGNAADRKEEANNKLHIVSTIFPIYDWTENILGTKSSGSETASNTYSTIDQSLVEHTLLLDGSTDIHSFEPSVKDIVTISNCDIFIYVGGESEAWVTKALEQAENKNMKVVRLMDCLEEHLKEEESVNSIKNQEELIEDSDEKDKEAESSEPEYDEHVWLSVRNASVCVDAIKDALIQADPDNAGIYDGNAYIYKNKLMKLDLEYTDMMSKAGGHTILVADRFPYRYLTDDYGIDYFAAFSGCSAESEADFETIKFLIDKMETFDLKAILVNENSDRKLADTIIKAAGEKNSVYLSNDVLELNSLQSVSLSDENADYMKLMEQNLNVLKAALR